MFEKQGVNLSKLLCVRKYPFWSVMDSFVKTLACADNNTALPIKTSKYQSRDAFACPLLVDDPAPTFLLLFLYSCSLPATQRIANCLHSEIVNGKMNQPNENGTTIRVNFHAS